MAFNPLEQPADSHLLRRFCRHFGIPEDLPPDQLLRRTIAAFARLPYENLSKIVRHDECPLVTDARRAPDEVVADHQRWGTGGTCFSLTAALLHLLRAQGWQAEPLLADRRYGANTHSALVVWIDGRPHLVDPGYLILEPIPLDSHEPLRIATSFNELLLTPRGPRQLELATRQQGGTTYRLTFKTEPVDAGEFLRAWDASFEWDMMHYPVLTRAGAEGQVYVQDRRWQRRTLGGVERHELSDDELLERIVREFGIHRDIARRAFDILKRR